MFSELLHEFYLNIIRFAPVLAVALLILLISYIISMLVKRAFTRIASRLDAGKSQVALLAGTVSKIVIILFGAITALGTVGVNVNALIAGLGLSGFAMGFALKDALSNLLAGSMILIYQPFLIGDRISVSGCEGIVVKIDLRYTVLKGDSQRYLIPNSSLFVNSITVIDKK